MEKGDVDERMVSFEFLKFFFEMTAEVEPECCPFSFAIS